MAVSEALPLEAARPTSGLTQPDGLETGSYTIYNPDHVQLQPYAYIDYGVPYLYATFISVEVVKVYVRTVRTRG